MLFLKQVSLLEMMHIKTDLGITFEAGTIINTCTAVGFPRSKCLFYLYILKLLAISGRAFCLSKDLSGTSEDLSQIAIKMTSINTRPQALIADTRVNPTLVITSVPVILRSKDVEVK